LNAPIDDRLSSREVEREIHRRILNALGAIMARLPIDIKYKKQKEVGRLLYFTALGVSPSLFEKIDSRQIHLKPVI
jgi:hypothetical protein